MPSSSRLRAAVRHAPLVLPIARRVYKLSERSITVNVAGRELSVPRDMNWGFRRAWVYYERNVVHWLERILARHDDPVAYDVGANAGYFTLLMSAHAKRVYAFEPVRETFGALTSNVNRNRLQNVVAVPVALGEERGTMQMRIYSSSGSNSLYVVVPDDAIVTQVGYEDVEVRTIDELVERGEVEPPDVIKIDVEGAEGMVLRGAQVTLARARPVILAEHNARPEFVATRTNLLDELQRADYALFGLTDEGEDFRGARLSDDHALHPLGSFPLDQVANVLAVPREREKQILGTGPS
jgi:FkbM family methyltransferase